MLHFRPDETVSVEPVVCPAATKRRLAENLLLFYTGVARASASVLTEARARMSAPGAARAALDGLNDLAIDVAQGLSRGRLGRFGNLLHNGWLLKKHMASNVTNGQLDRYYRLALRAGAEGGKIRGRAAAAACCCSHPGGRMQPSGRWPRGRSCGRFRSTSSPTGARSSTRRRWCSAVRVDSARSRRCLPPPDYPPWYSSRWRRDSL